MLWTFLHFHLSARDPVLTAVIVHDGPSFVRRLDTRRVSSTEPVALKYMTALLTSPNVRILANGGSIHG